MAEEEGAGSCGEGEEMNSINKQELRRLIEAGGYQIQPCTVLSLLDELDACKTDAERYRFIRSRPALDGINLQIDVGEPEFTSKGTIIARGKTADELVDLARNMAVQQRPPSTDTHDMDEDRIDRIAASHGDGEHYGEVVK